MVSEDTDIRERKKELRSRSAAVRREQPDKLAVSREIWRWVFELNVYGQAGTVMTYIGVGDEVETRPFLARLSADQKRIVVPYCRGGLLGLFRLNAVDELAPSTFGLLEPKRELRTLPERQVPADELDLLIVPGLAFDRRGGRLGHGKGYYDKLLGNLRPDAVAIGVAFECQILPAVPMLPHDVAMDLVATESALYRGRGR
ncbi:MAG: 5-formyltetrahydrofolate cyclo-ligase [Thermoguttaceae bacterium]|nr:5-formyltetrahydrofolate cyclo-ligase [Thermoguttaceae bacterium]